MEPPIVLDGGLAVPTLAAAATPSHPRLDAIVRAGRDRARERTPRLAIAWPCDALALTAARLMRADLGVDPLLVGPRDRILAVAGDHGIDLDTFEIVPTPDDAPEAARRAVALARVGAVSALMKGSLHTDELLSAVVDRTHGLRGERRISHAFVFDIPRYHKPLLVADCVVNIAPDLRTKRDILLNAADLLESMGIDRPKAGILAAVETVNPAIPATVDARELVAMGRAGEFGALRVDGPFGFDNAFSAAAARLKRIDSDVAGDADLLLVPDLNAGNMLYKSFTYVGGGDCGGVVLGAKVPVVLTSRADSVASRIASVALAVIRGAASRH